METAKSGNSDISSTELREDASAKIDLIKSGSMKERMQRVYNTGTAGKRYSAPENVTVEETEETADTGVDPAGSGTTIVPAGPGSDTVGPGPGPVVEPAVGPAAEIHP